MEYEVAALFEAGQPLELVQVSAGDLAVDEVLVRMVASGICHTDLTVQHGFFPAPLPIVLGHEGSGIVERVGAAVDDLAAGDPVVLSFMSCGSCAPCRASRPAYCDSFVRLNISGLRADGSTALSCRGHAVGGHFFGQSSFGRYAIANRRSVVRVRSDAPLDLLGPLGCGFQTGAGAIFNALQPAAGSSCVIFGAGGVGLSAVMAACVAECGAIIVVEPRADRRALALDLGATAAIDPASGVELAAQLQELTGGGADAVVETTGIDAVVTGAIASLGRGGRLGLIGMHEAAAEARFNILELLNKGAVIRAIIEGDSEPQTFIPHLVDLYMDGRFPIDRLVRFFDFADINAALAAQASGAVVKPVVRF